MIKQDDAELYNGDFGGYANTVHRTSATSTPARDLEFTFTVSMPSDASNANQNKTAGATYTWVTTQKDAGPTLRRELALTSTGASHRGTGDALTWETWGIMARPARGEPGGPPASSDPSTG